MKTLKLKYGEYYSLKITDSGKMSSITSKSRAIKLRRNKKFFLRQPILIVLLVVLSVIGAAVIAGYIVGLCITNEPAYYVIFSVGLFIAALFIGVPIAYVVHKLKELQK